MMLGKRPRPHMRRTTSITEFTVDLGYLEDLQQSPSSIDQQNQNQLLMNMSQSSSSSPRNHRRNSADFVETPHFLRVCGLCNHRLAPGRDIFMYRGDTAFCSLECRQQQMNQDERKEKCSFLSKIEASSTTTVGSETSSQGGTTVAAA